MTALRSDLPSPSGGGDERATDALRLSLVSTVAAPAPVVALPDPAARPTPSDLRALASGRDASDEATKRSAELSIETADAVIRQLLTAGLALGSTTSARRRRGEALGRVVDLCDDTLGVAAATIDRVIREIRHAVFEAIAAGSPTAHLRSEPNPRTTLRDASERLVATWLAPSASDASLSFDDRIAQAVRLLRNAERLMDPDYLWA